MDHQTKHYLVIRLSAMGDVVIASQVIRQVIHQNPKIQFHILTRPAFQTFFTGLERIHFIEPDLYGRHKGLVGLFRLYREINKEVKLSGVIDLHDVLRSVILRSFFQSTGKRVAVIQKNRRTRKELTRRENKIRQPLVNVIDLMANTFRDIGLPVKIDENRHYGDHFRTTKALKKGVHIGIAPTASTQEKTYPLHLMEEVIQQLLHQGFHVHIFGGGKKDEEVFEAWKGKIDLESLHSAIHGYSLGDQIALMKEMTLMLTMDSSNMHMARLVGVPVLSIWGATHPAGGYAPFGVKDEHTFIQLPIDQVGCRPCSIFGQKKCFREKRYCLEEISPDMVVDRINTYLSRFPAVS